MSQLFPKFTNKFAKISIVAKILGILGLLTLLFAYVRSPLYTDVGVEKQQPIPFSHKIHVGQLKMDCRYCHTSVEKAAFAGIPPTETCLKCHSVVKKDSPLLAPVHESKNSGMPIEWVRVHDLPDHVYFDHSIHIAKGIGCSTCHGQIDDMPVVKKKGTLQMQWCLQCHRHPEKNIRPKNQVFNMNWDENMKNHKDVAMLRNHLKNYQPESEKDLAKFQVRKPLNCSACHR